MYSSVRIDKEAWTLKLYDMIVYKDALYQLSFAHTQGPYNMVLMLQPVETRSSEFRRVPRETITITVRRTETITTTD